MIQSLRTVNPARWYFSLSCVHCIEENTIWQDFGGSVVMETVFDWYFGAIAKEAHINYTGDP